MCGAYILEMANPDEASRIISKFSRCPNWPVITKGPKENEVFILAIELKRQCHGDFSEDNNSLVKIPELIGARRIRFIRIQNWGICWEATISKLATPMACHAAAPARNALYSNLPARVVPSCSKYRRHLRTRLRLPMSRSSRPQYTESATGPAAAERSVMSVEEGRRNGPDQYSISQN